MSRNNNLILAKKKKDDEFYTMYEDIEYEMNYFKEELKNKIIYCNCDNYKFSNFFNYFYNNFEELELKKLICTHIKLENDEYSECIEVEKINNELNVKITKLKENGDFRSEECIEFLKECDIVITNPPFSLFIDFYDLLNIYNKKFIIISNYMVVFIKMFFKDFKNNIFYFGNKRSFKFKNKNKDVNCVFINNIKNNQNNEYLKLCNKNINEYEKFDNSDIINIDKSKDIPDNYFNEIAVPITFLHKINKEQFEIIDTYRGKINGKEKFRMLIKRKQ